jgi:hypothetical protein
LAQAALFRAIPSAAATNDYMNITYKLFGMALLPARFTGLHYPIGVGTGRTSSCTATGFFCEQPTEENSERSFW